MIPRDYQEASDEYLWRYIHAHPNRNPLVVLATGLGKSLCMAMNKWRLLATYPHVRILNITHVKELVEGNYKTLLRLWPTAPAGVYSSGLKRWDTTSQITFCGIQSARRNPKSFGHIDFVFVDECHRISDNAQTSYGKFFAELRKRNPNLIVIGYTATDYRMGSGKLTDGEMFDEVVFDVGSEESFIWAIQNGYLIRPVPKNPGFELDDSEIRIQGGEYVDSEASQAFKDQDILERAVDTMILNGVEQNRQAWLTFCQSIEDAELVADMFRYKGYPVEAVHSKRSDRDEVLKAFKEGGLRGVTNKDILTTGFDHPPIDMIGMLRLTRSPGLWVQMLGRGTRPFWVGHIGHNGGPPMYDITTLEGRLHSILASPKQNTLVLDFVGNTRRLGTINYPNLPKRRGKGGGGDMTRECPVCATFNHISRRTCEECGYEFPPPERIEDKASDKQLVESRLLDLTQQPDPPQYEVYGVHRMVCYHHNGKGGKRDTMRVDYFCGLNKFSTWVCFEHDENSFPRRMAEQWWRDHGGQGPAPTDVSEAVQCSEQFTKPKFIRVWINTKYPEIKGYDFRGTRFELPPEAGGPPLQDPEPDPFEEARKEQEQRQQNIREMMYDDDIPF